MSSAPTRRHKLSRSDQWLIDLGGVPGKSVAA
jgi:hypothetical protein